MGNAYTYITLKRRGKLWSGENANLTLVLYTSGGADASITETSAEVGSTGTYIGTLPLAGLSDGWYLALWTHSKNKLWKAEWIHVVDNEMDFIAHEADLDTVIADTNELQTDWANGGRLDAIIDAILVDTNSSIPATIATVDSNVDAILVDTGTTIPATLGTPADTDLATDIKNVLDQANKLDSAAMVAPSSVTNNSFADYLLNKDGSQTFDQSTDSMEAIRDRGDSAWGSSGASTYDISVLVNSSTATKYITIVPRKNNMVYTATTLAVEILLANPGGTMATKQTISEASTNADGVFDLLLTFTPAAGKLYLVKGSITMDGAVKTVADGFVAFG